MTEPGNARILILEADQALAQRMVQILEDQGWEVFCKHVSKEALALLEETKKKPFDLFISSYKLPKMAGDDVLKAARAISPLTQRMLLLPSDQADLLIRAINKAEINACLVTPASDRDLINQVTTCLQAFKKRRKLDQLKRVTVHQNKQLFKIAQKLKKKDQLCQERINKKKAELLVLRSRLKQQAPKEISLDRRIKDRGISLTPTALEAEFMTLAAFANGIFDRAAELAGLAPLSASPKLEGDDAAGAPAEDMAALAGKIVTAALAASDRQEAQDAPGERDDAMPAVLEDMVKITITDDRTRAYARLNLPLAAPELLNLNDFLTLLQDKGIHFGIFNDKHLEAWINAPEHDDKPFCVAAGETPVNSRDGSVAYEFKVNYTNPGKIQGDGSIDFRDRGNIPYVSKKDLLAVKTPPGIGKNGVAVTGEPIEVDEPFDPVFVAGNGTRLSEDGLSIYADLDGQPHLDHMGEVSVNPDLPINGDVDFQTGNIDFKGNITVTGTVKAGFTVKGVNLTAKEIEGATIDLTGDLQISDGITDANIISSGNIYAKFINNSKVKAFGNCSVQKEIIDSMIMVSGACENASGIILASKISAKGGIEAGKIGTPSATPTSLKVGADDHITMILSRLDEKLKASVDQLKEIRGKIQTVEEQDQDLYAQITAKAQEQETAQRTLKALESQLTALKDSGDKAGLDQALIRVKKTSQTLKQTEQELNAIFDVQDQYAKSIERFKKTAENIETANKQLVLKKKGLRDYSNSLPSTPRLRVHQHISQDTAVAGPNTTYTLREDRGRCQIIEKKISEDGLHFYEIDIADL